MRGSQQVTEFRSKLIRSGFFSAVSVDEQTPSPDRQKFTVRITAQWKPAGAREHASIDPTPEEIEQLKNRAKEAQFSMPPEMEMPPGLMPPGMMPPGLPGAMPPQMRPTPPGMPKSSPGKRVIQMDANGVPVLTTNAAASESKTNEVKVEIKEQ